MTSLQEIADEFSELTLLGENRDIEGFASPNRFGIKNIIWIKERKFMSSDLSNVAVLTEDNALAEELSETCSVLYCNGRSRYFVAAIHTKYFEEPDLYTENCADQWKERGVIIADGAYIGPEATIGKDTFVGPNVTIIGHCEIGEHCRIEANTVIGARGMGLEWDGEQFMQFPQVGRVVVKDHCSIGPLSTIRRGALVDTVINDHVHIGSLCNVGHNVQIGAGTLLTSSVCVSGSVNVGKRVFLGVGTTIRNKVKLGSHATIGQGSVVISDVPEGATFVGNPAKGIK